MRKGILLIIALFLSQASWSTVVPTSTETNATGGNTSVITSATLNKTAVSTKGSSLKKNISRIQQKMQFWILKHLLPKKSRREGSSDLAQTAMILSIIGLAAILVPYVNLLSIPLAILGLVFGYKALRADPSNKKAKTAVILGWITLGLWILIGFLVLIFISALII